MDRGERATVSMIEQPIRRRFAVYTSEVAAITGNAPKSLLHRQNLFPLNDALAPGRFQAAAEFTCLFGSSERANEGAI
jgi:hypothetical protein